MQSRRRSTRQRSRVGRRAARSARVTGIEKFAGGAVTLRTVARVDPYRRDDVARDAARRIKQALDEEGIATFVPPALPVA